MLALEEYAAREKKFNTMTTKKTLLVIGKVSKVDVIFHAQKVRHERFDWGH